MEYVEGGLVIFGLLTIFILIPVHLVCKKKNKD
jgi:hypothetical protein